MTLWAGLWVGFSGLSARKFNETMVGPCGLEPQTSTVSRWRSNQLSYGPGTLVILAQRGE